MKKNWMDYKIGFFPLPIYILLFVLLCIAQYFGAIKIVHRGSDLWTIWMWYALYCR